MKKAVVLVSGGLDSTTVVAIAKSRGFEIFPISFMYSQRHKVELDRAKESMHKMGVKNHKLMNIDLRSFGGSSLTDDSIDVKQYSDSSEIENHVTSSYVPARNTIFLSLSLAYAETIGAFDIFMGAHKQDAANYPDCRKEYLESYEKMANMALGATADSDKKINIHAPLIEMEKSDIIKKGMELGVDYSNTISCYNPSEDSKSCGKCLSCTIRLEAFKKIGVKDPIEYI